MRRLASALGVVTAVLLAGPAGAAQAECHDIRPEPPTRVTHRAPPAGLLSRMAVLRRPQQAGDMPDFDISAFPFHLLATDHVRKVAQVGRTKYYLIPGSPSFPRLTRRCLRQLSPHRRRVEQRIERSNRKRARVIGIGTFDFAPIDGSGFSGGGSCCADAHALLANRTVMTSGGNHRSTVSAFVPDGVVSVTLRWHRGPERNATVSNNFWHTTVPLSAPRAFPHSTLWRDAAGHLVKSFREPGGR